MGATAPVKVRTPVGLDYAVVPSITKREEMNMEWQESWPHPLGVLFLAAGVWIVIFWLFLIVLATHIVMEGVLDVLR